MSAKSARFSFYDGMPKGAFSLFLIQTFSTLGFAVLYSSLVLYATKHLGFSEASATAIMGVFGAFNYGLHLFGGYLGGRYLSNRNLFILGMLLQVIGCASIATETATGMYWGLAMFLTGSGLNVTCLNMMLTQRFTPDDHRREKAFLWNYAGMNLGFFVGFSVAGYFQLTDSYHALFIFAALGNAISIILSFVNWNNIRDLDTPLLKESKSGFFRKMSVGILVLIVLIPIIRMLLTHAELSQTMVLCLGAIVGITLVALTVKHKNVAERKRMVAYLILAMGSLVFWALYQLAPMGLVLFAEHNMRLQIGDWHIAPQWLQNINTIVIVLGGPTMSALFTHLRKKGWRVDIPTQFCLALFCIGFGVLLLPLGIHFAAKDGEVALKWMVLSYLVQSVGELLISPIGYSMVGKLAPSRYQGMMMGSWMMVTGVASVMASYFSGLMPQSKNVSPLVTNPGYSHVFSWLGWCAVGMGVILFICIPLLRRLINDKAPNVDGTQAA